MSELSAGRQGHTRRRAVNACRACRQRKVKCSGMVPCLNCVNRNETCTYDEAERKVVILERHFRALQRKAASSQSRSPGAAEQVFSPNGVETYEEHSLVSLQERRFSQPIVHSRDEEDQGSERPRPRVSNWAFLADIYTVLKPMSEFDWSKVDSNGAYDSTLHEELGRSAASLPSKDYIMHLAQTVDFHLNSTFCFFDLVKFREQLNAAFPYSLQKASKLWQVKILLVIALGKLFLGNGATRAGPPGNKEFLQAVNSNPSNVDLIKDPVTAVEALCLLSFYAQAADMHEVAYLYSGQALRIGQLNGLGRKSLLLDDVRHVQNLYWTAYVIDQRQAAIVGAGAPSTLDDQHSTSLLADDSHHFNNPEMKIHVALAGILGQITSVLSDHDRQDVMGTSVVDGITSCLTSLQKLAQEIHQNDKLCYDSSLSTISRKIATLHLSYYHCIIIATQPVLLHLVNFQPNRPSFSASMEAASQAVFGMLRSGIISASLSLNIISALYEHNLLESFSFFDLEITILAALSLALSNIIIPDCVAPLFLDVGKTVLESMARKGNVPAANLKMELENICQLSREISGSLPKNFYPSIHQKPIVMAQDGDILNNTILEVIEVHTADNDLRRASHSLQAFPASSISDQVPQNAPTLLQRLEMESSMELSHQNLSTRPDDIYLDYSLADVGNMPTFSTEDLQWLDSVQ